MMDFIKSNAWRLWPMFGLALSLFVLGNTYGQYRTQAKCDAQKATAEIHAAQVEASQAQVTTSVVTEYAKQAPLVRERGNEIVKKVPIYVPSQTGPAVCSLPNGWRVLHDAAASGELPDPAASADAAPTTAQDAATAVTSNYAACHINAEHLKALQSWVRAQQQVIQ